MPMTYDLNLREYWRTIRKRKVIVVFTIVAMTLFSFSFAIMGSPTPVYKASASVKVEKTGSLTGLYIQAISWSATNYMETQMAMIKSYFILEMVAKRMGLIPPAVSSEDVRNNPRYLSIVLNLKERVQTEQEGNSDIINITASSEDPRQAQRLANTVAQVYKERHGLELNRRITEAKRFVENQLAVTREQLQTAEDAIREYREDNRMVSLDSQSSAIVGQLTTLQAANERHLATLNRIEHIAKVLERAEETPLSSKNVFYFEEASIPYKNLNDRLVQLMLERDILLLNYTDDFPQVMEVKKQIHEIVTSLKAQLRAQQQNLLQSVELTKKQIARLDDQLLSLPAKGLELARLEREVGVNREVYTMLAKQHQEALIQDAEKLEEVQIVKPALEPSQPTNPPKTAATTGLGLIIGIVLGVVFAFVVETFDTSIGAAEEVEEFLGARVLGIIPHSNIEEVQEIFREKFGRDVDKEELWRIGRLASHFAPKTTSAESYRALRTNINFAKLEKDAKTIVFTSSSPQEGKTTVSINLAIAMAQAGSKVLLIDGDFRRPVISKIFGIPSVPGLTDVILGNYKWRGVVRSITDLMMGQMSMEELMLTPGLDNLFVMTSGTAAPNPAELVGTKVNREVIAEVHGEYDFVIIDAPPILAATDAAIWANMADGVVIVYQVGKVARGALKRAKAQIDNVRASILGIVLNGLKAEISPDYDYHDKYYYYYGSERKKKLTLKEKVLSWRERLRQSGQSLPGKLRDLRKQEKTPKAEGFSRVRLGGSRLWKIILLMAALGLLIAGLYSLLSMQRILQAPVRTGEPSAKVAPRKVEAVPAPQPQAVPVPAPLLAPQGGAGAGQAPGAATPPQAGVTAGEEAMAGGKTSETPPVQQTAAGKRQATPVSAPPAPAQVAPGAGGAKPLPGAAAAPREADAAGKREAPLGNNQGASKVKEAARAAPVGTYALQVRATQDPDAARRTVASLRAKGHDAFQETIDLKGKGVWHRIFIGRFATREEAQRYAKDTDTASAYPDAVLRRTGGSVERAQDNKGVRPRATTAPVPQ